MGSPDGSIHTTHTPLSLSFYNTFNIVGKNDVTGTEPFGRGRQSRFVPTPSSLPSS
jgi:hypothetical protein